MFSSAGYANSALIFHFLGATCANDSTHLLYCLPCYFDGILCTTASSSTLLWKFRHKSDENNSQKQSWLPASCAAPKFAAKHWFGSTGLTFHWRVIPQTLSTYFHMCMGQSFFLCLSQCRPVPNGLAARHRSADRWLGPTALDDLFIL